MEEVLKNLKTTLNLSYDEFERVKDIVHKHGGVNWKDALGSSQVVSKLAVINKLKTHLECDHSLSIVGGWVGLIPYLMHINGLSCEKVINIDIDQVALAASDAFNSEISFPYELYYEDAYKVNYGNWKKPFVINTSCEHFQNYREWINLIPSGTMCILQNNDMFGIPDHVNCYSSLDEFAATTGLSTIIEKTQFDIGDGWKRFMVTGIR